MDYELIHEISFDLTCIVKDGRFVDANERFLHHLGYTREELVDQECLSFVHPDDLSEAIKAYKEKAASVVHRFRRADGTYLWLEWHGGESGELLYGVCRDVTSEKLISDQLGRYVIDLQRSEREAQVAKEEAEMMAYAASHDLQEPLRTIQNWANFLGEDYGHLLPEDGREQLKYIIDSAERGRVLVLDLLRLSRVGRDGSFGWVSMNEAVDGAVVDVEFSTRETKAQITRDELPVIWGDISMLRLLVKNLFSNAIKFAKPDEVPRVHVSWEEHTDEWVFYVKDEGVGMEPAFSEKVFGVFTRLDRSKPGTGIGLAICKKVIKLHDGSIAMLSEPGIGSTVRFTIKKNRSGKTNESQTRIASGGSSTRRQATSAGVGKASDPPLSTRSEGRDGGVVVLAAGGALRDRPTGRSSFVGSELAEGFWLRSVGGGKS